MEILLLVLKTILFVLEVVFGLWNRQKEKTLNAQIIKRLDALENQVKKLKP